MLERQARMTLRLGLVTRYVRSRKSRFVACIKFIRDERRRLASVLIALEITFRPDCGRKFG